MHWELDVPLYQNLEQWRNKYIPVFIYHWPMEAH